MFQRTTAINKLLKLKKRNRVIQGGTSAGKTWGILPILIDYACKHSKCEISIVSETIPHLRRGAMRDFLKILDITGRYRDDFWNKSLLTYRFENGSYIEFFSADSEARVRGARRDVLYINEANNIDFDTYHQLSIRTRKINWLDFNPSAEFWAHKELMHDSNSDFVILTYKDNEALDSNIRDEIERARDKAMTSKYWENWWRVYGLGEIGLIQGVVLGNWEQIAQIPEDARLIGLGMDFGFTNDPTSIVGLYKYDGKYIVDEICYRTEMSNTDISEVLSQYKNIPIIADSAEPKTIRELQGYGHRIIPCDKGKDSVIHGLNLIQQHEVYYITAQSLNVIKEHRAYVWKTDKTGKNLNVPIEMHNHSIDALRYVHTYFQGGRKGHYDIR